jgi:fructose-bisphosphate aldolase class II
MTAKIREVFATDPKQFDPRSYLGPARSAVADLVRRKLHVLGCAGKAGQCL